ncbi:MAG: VWA domain-containing protein [Verrucomicrobia bacterium]|nr:VWA domain-containing protein [Verrucomicrobiota bacterium]
MTFEHTHLVWFALLAIPALIAFYWWAGRVKRRLIGQFIAARLLSSLTIGLSTKRQRLRAGLFIAAVVLTILSLARPQVGFSWEEAKSRGLDIVVAIDTSRSMLATDVAPNRLRRAQLAALDLKRLARADRLGLVAFAGSAFLQCPLTLDDEAFRQSVDALDVNIIPQGGTALSEAIAAARGAFKKDNDNHKVLVLFTDGEDHDGSALDAAKSAGKDGLRIFTVGVGTANGELLRPVDASGRTDFIKDSDGNVVKSRLNETLLKEMAQATGGFYLMLSGANTMNVLYERGLAPLPKSDLASQRIKRPHERYQWVLGLAIVLLLIEMLLPERVLQRSSPALAGNGTTALLAAILAAGVFAEGTVQASNDEGTKEYKAGNYPNAQAAYEAALIKKPTDARLQFNAGTAAYQATNYSVALSHFNSALTNADVNLQQKLYYNMGNTLFRIGEASDAIPEKQKQWEQSLKSFQNAVALRTNDVDAVFNARFVNYKLAELREMLRLLDEARKAKRRSEEAVKRRDYETALRIMAPMMTNSAVAKEMQDYVQRLQQIHEINSPPQQ